MDLHEWVGLLLGVFLITVGMTHFLIPAYYERLVPKWLPPARRLVWVSGVAEVLIGSLVLYAPTRTLGAWLAAGLITTYLPSHLDALARCRGVRWRDPLFGPPGAAARLVANLAYVLWAVWVAAASGSTP